MTLLALLALAAAWWMWRHNTRRRTGAGASAAARARQLRTPSSASPPPSASTPGPVGRHSTGRPAPSASSAPPPAWPPLTQQGWALRFDLALPPGEGSANVDALAISPNGGVFVLDPKLWTSRYPVTVRVGRVWHGDRDVSDRITSARDEAAAVSRALGVPDP
ncbi:nuclease-related domain-containing protein [Streptomyces zaomyceticus]|uniref:nuclease-related domain-containing protein n=1 Tax=Streptomyces zaomyceticus TaxID=68286 RepID=UPI0037959C87